MNKYIYFICDDTMNHKLVHLLSCLESHLDGRLVILSSERAPKNEWGYRQLSLTSKAKSSSRMLLWSKLIYLFARVPNSRTDMFFPKRNLYSGGRMSKLVVRFLWFLKIRIRLNSLFPLYEDLFFLPMAFKSGRIKTRNRVFIYDAVLFRNCALTHLLYKVKRSNSEEYALVSSWDNPFYCQLSAKAKNYMVWSKQMLSDISKSHNLNIKKENYIEVGPFPFKEFYDTRTLGDRAEVQNNKIVIGYACVYCDEFLMNAEIRFIAELANELRMKGVEYEILMRPYPSIDVEIYKSLLSTENMVIYEPKDAVYLDRYGDGNEKILFSSDDERHNYLSKCNVFLSLGTSFTIEAAIDNMPILHLYIPDESRSSADEEALFGRVDISDHLLEYFNKELFMVSSKEELCRSVLSMANGGFTILIERNPGFLKRFGFDNFLGESFYENRPWQS